MKDLNMKKSKSKRHPVQARKQKRSFDFLNSKSGEGYVDVAVTVMIVAFVLVFAVNVVSLVALNQNLKTVSDQIDHRLCDTERSGRGRQLCCRAEEADRNRFRIFL